MRIGIDLGGTKIEAVVMDADGAIRHQRRIASPSHNYREIVNAIADLVDQLEGAIGQTCTVGIGTPGAPSLTSGLMKNCNSTQLNGKSFKHDLEQGLSREIRMANDANCFALSEASDGAGAHGGVVFGAILGTGVGGGVVFKGQLMRGRNAIAGEWGHITLPGVAEGRQCYCGKQDCVETYLNGEGLLKTGRAVLPALGSTHELAELAKENTQARAILERYSEQLAAALAVVVNIVDPDVIVLGGGLSNIDYLYRSLPRLMKGHVFGEDFNTEIVKARFGDASGVRGAAWLWSSDERSA